MRKLKLKNTPTLVPVKKKMDRREATRERKAEAAAKLEKAIETELLDRLKSKAYGDQPLNVNEKLWREILGGDKIDVESDVSEEEEEEEESVMLDEGEFVFDESDDDLEDMYDTASVADTLETGYSEEEEEEVVVKKRKGKQFKTNGKRSKRHLEIEYEHETTTQSR
jgi:protein MAK16